FKTRLSCLPGKIKSAQKSSKLFPARLYLLLYCFCYEATVITGIRVGELVALKQDVFDNNIFKMHRTEIRDMGENGNIFLLIRQVNK
ncbi:MAG: hypothetical protein NC081_00005, partial [Roseburia sp.]|nr:hypothetical protein [Roseburia sp.]